MIVKCEAHLDEQDIRQMIYKHLRAKFPNISDRIRIYVLSTLESKVSFELEIQEDSNVI